MIGLSDRWLDWLLCYCKAPAQHVVVWRGNWTEMLYYDLNCTEHMQWSINEPRATGNQYGARWAYAQPLVRPDTATPEQIVCIEFILHRFCELWSRACCP